jgi:Mycotoxin biosynthesis protein UstYa
MIREVYYGILTQKYNLDDYITNGQPKAKPNLESNPYSNRIHSFNPNADANATGSRKSILTGLVDNTKHCFDYILQGIKCAGDMTAEPASHNDSKVIDGWGVAHQCKSFDAAAEFMKSHKADL